MKRIRSQGSEVGNQDKRISKKTLEIAKNIKLLILDVDGVMTDGSIILDNEGNEFKAFNVRDGHGLRMLAKAGVRVAIISGRQSKVVERRAQELGISDVYQKCYAKLAAFDHIMEKYDLADDEVAFVGDDVVDIPVLKRAGLSIAVNDAADDTKEFAAMVTKNCGGKGAVREVCDFLLRARGSWESITKEYFDA